MNLPLVSVICLCYNQEEFVAEAIQSVIRQSYKNIQLIVIDDFSRDGSVAVIDKYIAHHPSIQFLPLRVNIGNCRAFNQGLKMAKGEFVIDLSGDDVLMPDRVEKGVRALQAAGEKYGVQFSDAECIDRKGNRIGFHSDKYPHDSIPQGAIYKELLSRYFINSPTMMIRMEVLAELNGYDENLTYEDFDFWVRSSRMYDYLYIPESLVKRRILDSSLGQHQYKRGSQQMISTYVVCEKARLLNRNNQENRALRKRIRYEMAHSLRIGEYELARKYFRLWRTI